MSRAALNKLDYDDDDDDDVVDARQKGICEDKFSKNKMKKNPEHVYYRKIPLKYWSAPEYPSYFLFFKIALHRKCK